MTAALLDASAVLALLHQERGAAEVEPWVAAGAISAVNVAEVVGKLVEAGMPTDPALEALEGLGLDVVEFSVAMGIRAGLLRPATRVLGLSLGDRACIATALEMDMPVVTADRNWTQLELELEIHVVR